MGTASAAEVSQFYFETFIIYFVLPEKHIVLSGIKTRCGSPSAIILVLSK